MERLERLERAWFVHARREDIFSPGNIFWLADVKHYRGTKKEVIKHEGDEASRRGSVSRRSHAVEWKIGACLAVTHEYERSYSL